MADADSALRVAVEALYDAADDDSATGGPDLVRGIYPTAVVIGAEGAEEVPEERIADVGPGGHRKPFPGRHFRSGCCAPVHTTRGETRELSIFHLARAGDARALGARAQGNRPGPQRVALAYADGVLFVAENPSRSLQKVSELYDRVGFAAVGRFNEFDNLRRGGIQFADTRGYAYDRRDVTGRQLANVYARRSARSSPSRPSPTRSSSAWPRSRTSARPNRLSSTAITYDGSIADEPHFVVMGGTTEPIAAALNESYTENARPVGGGRRSRSTH